MNRPKTKGAHHDYDNPPLDDATLARMRPAREVVPEIVKAAPKIGRPKAEHPKEPVKLRLDRDIVTYYRNTGPGWQTRINDTLRKAARLKQPPEAAPKKRRAG